MAYVLLRLLGEKNVDLKEIQNEFPQVRELGTSLHDLKKFFGKKGYFCDIRKFTNEDILKSTNSSVFYRVARASAKKSSNSKAKNGWHYFAGN